MTQRDNRPKFLNLLHIRFPVGAVTSIAHRLSGIVLFLALPLGAYVLDLSLRNPAGFEQAGKLLTQPVVRLVLVLLAWSVSHHLLAGIRFLLLDLGIGLARTAARRMAWLVNLLAPVFALALLWRWW